jgi:hypothetical protein
MAIPLLSYYSLSMDYNVSHEWNLATGEAILVPDSFGAYIACSSYQNLGQNHREL